LDALLNYKLITNGHLLICDYWIWIQKVLDCYMQILY